MRAVIVLAFLALLALAPPAPAATPYCPHLTLSDGVATSTEIVGFADYADQDVPCVGLGPAVLQASAPLVLTIVLEPNAPATLAWDCGVNGRPIPGTTPAAGRVAASADAAGLLTLGFGPVNCPKLTLGLTTTDSYGPRAVFSQAVFALA